MSQKAPQIIILGVGNVLLCDEGVGVRVLRELEARYDFSPNVKTMDGGVLGFTLTGVMMAHDKVIVVDAVRGGDEPGTLYRFEWQARPEHIKYKDSLHQIDLMETMAVLPLMGQAPEVVVLGVEFAEISQWGLKLTPKVEAAVEPLVSMVLEELKGLGYPATAKPQPQKVAHVLGSAREDYGD